MTTDVYTKAQLDALAKSVKRGGFAASDTPLGANVLGLVSSYRKVLVELKEWRQRETGTRKATPRYHEFVAVYVDWRRGRTGSNASLKPAEGKALKRIITELLTNEHVRASPDPPEHALDVWRMLLARYDELGAWHAARTSLLHLHKHLDEILGKLRQGPRHRAKPTQRAAADAASGALDRLSRRGRSDGAGP